MLAAGCGTKDPQGRSTASVTVWQVGIASNEGVPRFTQRRSFPHGDTINALAWAPDGSAVAAGDDDGDLKIWILGEENASVDVDHPGSNDVRALSWSPDGKTLASGRTDERVFVWDVSELNAPILLSTGTGHNDGKRCNTDVRLSLPCLTIRGLPQTSTT